MSIADQAALVVEQKLRQGLRKLRLSRACRTQEKEDADRSAGVFEAGLGCSDCLRHYTHRMFLADDSPGEGLLHPKEPLTLFPGKAFERHPAPVRHHRSDFLDADIANVR